MRLNKSSEYAIRAAFRLKDEEPERFVPLKDIAEELAIPYHQWAKVAQKLVAAGIFASLTGPTGGVRLAKAPKEIALMDIIEATGGNEYIDRCLLGLDECGSENPCPVHNHWAPVKDALIDLFQSKTLADLVIPDVIVPVTTAEKEVAP